MHILCSILPLSPPVFFVCSMFLFLFLCLNAWMSSCLPYLLKQEAAHPLSVFTRLTFHSWSVSKFFQFYLQNRRPLFSVETPAFLVQDIVFCLRYYGGLLMVWLPSLTPFKSEVIFLKYNLLMSITFLKFSHDLHLLLRLTLKLAWLTRPSAVRHLLTPTTSVCHHLHTPL